MRRISIPQRNKRNKELDKAYFDYIKSNLEIWKLHNQNVMLPKRVAYK